MQFWPWLTCAIKFVKQRHLTSGESGLRNNLEHVIRFTSTLNYLAGRNWDTCWFKLSALFQIIVFMVTKEKATLTAVVMCQMFAKTPSFQYKFGEIIRRFECAPQVFPLLASFVLLEWLILWLKGRPLPKLGDSAASTSMIIYMQATR